MIVEFSHHPTRMFAVLFYYSGLILNFYFMEKDDTANYCKKKNKQKHISVAPYIFQSLSVTSRRYSSLYTKCMTDRGFINHNLKDIVVHFLDPLACHFCRIDNLPVIIEVLQC